ncbi:uncharacterized protein METZ01_LOCUS334547, partial [marine metagenome]
PTIASKVCLLRRRELCTQIAFSGSKRASALNPFGASIFAGRSEAP